MIKTISILLICLFTIPAYSNISITCPEDKVVHAFDLDTDYESYGDPEVISQESYTLDKDIIIEELSGCDSLYAIIKYTAINASGQGSSCQQRIDIQRAVIADIIPPEDQEYDGISIDEAQNHKLSFLPQYDKLRYGFSNLFPTYADQIIHPLGGQGTLKILRQWTVLDWCTGDLFEHNQILKILNFEPDQGTPLFTVETCSGATVNIIDLKVTTNHNNFQVDLSNCQLFDSDITSIMNCVAENNLIDPDKSFILSLYAPNDYLNGVSTLDIVMALRHILSISPFTDQCSLTAADVNSDGLITALDLLLIRRLILGLTESFDNSPSWRIVNANFLDDNVAKEEKDLIFEMSEFPISEIELKAIKMGDVNGTAN